MNDKTYLKYLHEQGLFDFTDKKSNIDQLTMYMLSRTQQMFTWSGLPDTIPQRMLEIYIQVYGFTSIVKVGDDLYAMWGGLGGEPDAYYQPTMLTVANPYLKYNATLEIHKDCEIILNDPFYIGLIPMYNKYASQLAENELSMYMAEINTRIQTILSAGDDATKEAAQKFIDDIVKGKLTAISNNAFLDSLKSIPVTASQGKTGAIGDLIEAEQYIKASWYNEIGLNANYNMKREALNTAESTINNDILFPLADEMLRQRKEGAERVNNMFGTDISVELASSWDDNKKEEQTAIDDLEDAEDDDIDKELKEGDEK